MLRGYRLVICAALGLAVVLAFLIVDLTSVSAAHEHRAADSARYYAANAKDDVRRCVAGPSESYADCVRKAEQTARENERVEYDLAAQRITAWWSQIMGVAAMIGMALSAVGVVLVWTTFRETKRGVDLHESGDRPYLYTTAVDELGGTRVDVREEAWEIQALVKLINIGKVPTIISEFDVSVEHHDARMFIGARRGVFLESPLEAGAKLEARAEAQITPNQGAFAKHRSGEKPILINARVIFAQAGGPRREIKRTWRMVWPADTFVEWGGNARNYEKVLKA